MTSGQSAEPIALRYSAPRGCPDADAFFAGVRARANVTRAERAERTFDVSIMIDGGVVHGTLQIAAPDGNTNRSVSGASCAETASALALVAALAIQERAAVPIPPPTPRKVPPPVISVAASGAERAALVARGVTETSPWTITMGAGFGRYDRIAPSAAYGIPAFVGVARGHQELRLGFAVTERVSDAMATSDFRWTSGRVSVSPYVLAPTVIAPIELAVAPSVGFEAGVLDARGLSVGMPASDLRPWLAPDVALRIGVGYGRVALEIEALLAAPLVHDRFFIAPSTTVHQIPTLTTGATANLAVSL